MPTTPNFALRYPIGTDSPAGHTQMQNLAEDTDAALSGLPIIQAKKSIIAAEQTRSAADWGYLGTNDKVTGIVLPTDGLIAVLFDAQFKSSVDSAGRAAIFLNGVQARSHSGAGDDVQEAETSGTDSYRAVISDGAGLAIGSAIATPTPTTGMIIGSQGFYVVDSTVIPFRWGGPCYIFADAGTYEVGIKFKRDSGDVTAKERKLWVWTMAFD